MGYTLAFNLELIYISGMEVIALTSDLCMCFDIFQIGINPHVYGEMAFVCVKFYRIKKIKINFFICFLDFFFYHWEIRLLMRQS